MRFYTHARLDEAPDDDEPLDVWSFRALERLKVHEARTEADLWSAAGPGVPVGERPCGIREGTSYPNH